MARWFTRRRHALLIFFTMVCLAGTSLMVAHVHNAPREHDVLPREAPEPLNVYVPHDGAKRRTLHQPVPPPRWHHHRAVPPPQDPEARPERAILDQQIREVTARVEEMERRKQGNETQEENKPVSVEGQRERDGEDGEEEEVMEEYDDEDDDEEDQEYYDADYPHNPEFKMADFDVKNGTVEAAAPREFGVEDNGYRDVEDEIYRAENERYEEERREYGAMDGEEEEEEEDDDEAMNDNGLVVKSGVAVDKGLPTHAKPYKGLEARMDKDLNVHMKQDIVSSQQRKQMQNKWIQNDDLNQNGAVQHDALNDGRNVPNQRQISQQNVPSHIVDNTNTVDENKVQSSVKHKGLNVQSDVALNPPVDRGINETMDKGLNMQIRQSYEGLNMQIKHMDKPNAPTNHSKVKTQQNVEPSEAFALPHPALMPRRLPPGWLFQNRIETQIPPAADPGDPGAAAAAPSTQIQTPQRSSAAVVSARAAGSGLPLVVDHVFWSPEVEQLVPPGVSAAEAADFASRARSVPAAVLRPAAWNACGRAKNQYVQLKDGTRACARYRHPQDALVYGELLTFVLSRVLGVDAVPAVALVSVDASAPRWAGVDTAGAGWTDGTTAALIQWRDGLNDVTRSRVLMPPLVLAAYETDHPLTAGHPELPGLSADQLSLLLQWSDMLLLDYITGHYDRVASMQDGAEREGRPGVLAESIRNLRRASAAGKLWLIDNESGLLDAYSLMYGGRDGRRNDTRFFGFHERMLRSMCIFRRQTVERVWMLLQDSQSAELLLSLAERQDPLFSRATVSSFGAAFHRRFAERLRAVVGWVRQCTGAKGAKQ